LYQEVRTFVVEIPAEPLELGGEQDRVRVVDLLRRVPPAWPATAHAAVGALDLVEGSQTIFLPVS
jgi:hypothetical protein